MIAIDLVCQMEVDTETAEWKSEYQGKTYYFCGPGCKRTFDKEPEKYIHAGHDHDHAGHEHHH